MRAQRARRGRSQPASQPAGLGPPPRPSGGKPQEAGFRAKAAFGRAGNEFAKQKDPQGLSWVAGPTRPRGWRCLAERGEASSFPYRLSHKSRPRPRARTPLFMIIQVHVRVSHLWCVFETTEPNRLSLRSRSRSGSRNRDQGCNPCGRPSNRQTPED